MKPGVYRAVAAQIDFGYNENTGTPQAAILFSIEEGECEGETITGYLYFSEKAAERSIETLRKMGWDGVDIGDITIDDVCNTMEIVVAEEEFNGRVVTKVRYINSLGERGPLLKSTMNAEQRSVLLLVFCFA